ncbi:MAG: hypothetical protein RR396_04745, partial [Clostridiales bacterium]
LMGGGSAGGSGIDPMMALSALTNLGGMMNTNKPAQNTFNNPPNNNGFANNNFQSNNNFNAPPPTGGMPDLSAILANMTGNMGSNGNNNGGLPDLDPNQLMNRISDLMNNLNQQTANHQNKDTVDIKPEKVLDAETGQPDPPPQNNTPPPNGANNATAGDNQPGSSFSPEAMAPILGILSSFLGGNKESTANNPSQGNNQPPFPGYQNPPVYPPPNYQPPNGYPPPNYQPPNGYPPPNYQPPNGYPPPNYQPPNGYPPPNYQPPNGYPGNEQQNPAYQGNQNSTPYQNNRFNRSKKRFFSNNQPYQQQNPAGQQNYAPYYYPYSNYQNPNYQNPDYQNPYSNFYPHNPTDAYWEKTNNATEEVFVDSNVDKEKNDLSANIFLKNLSLEKEPYCLCDFCDHPCSQKPVDLPTFAEVRQMAAAWSRY